VCLCFFLELSTEALFGGEMNEWISQFPLSEHWVERILLLAISKHTMNGQSMNQAKVERQEAKKNFSMQARLRYVSLCILYKSSTVLPS